MYKKSFRRGTPSKRYGKRRFGGKRKGGAGKRLTRYTLSRGGIRL